MSEGLTRATITAVRGLLSGSAILVISVMLAVCLGFYAKLLWRAALFGWSLIL